jgi:L,D-peptidoglycan transpeptidase YkuD (ErfK/YbiS/YcfS/YnhG family)
MLITTATAQNPHVVLAISADKGGKWTFSRAPNTSGGSAIVSYNRDQSSSTTSGTTITHTATYVSAGTVLDRGIVGAAGGNPTSVTGGGATPRPEWILAASTLYLVRFVADNATTITNIRAEYYYED